MITQDAIFFIIIIFLGYLVGRWSDNYLNIWIGDPHWLPDHWIYGLALMAIGIFFLKGDLEIPVFAFGSGLFISDLKDFLDLKFYGSDGKDKSKIKFWDID